MRRSIQLILAVILVGVLTACGVRGTTPNHQLVRRAIALQASQTQQELSQQLRLKLPDSSKIVVGRVNITAEEPLTIQNLPAYRVQGTYDYKLTLAKQAVALTNNPFEVYLQRQSEGKTWRLAQRQREEMGASWVTQILE